MNGSWEASVSVQFAYEKAAAEKAPGLERDLYDRDSISAFLLNLLSKAMR